MNANDIDYNEIDNKTHVPIEIPIETIIGYIEECYVRDILIAIIKLFGNGYIRFNCKQDINKWWSAHKYIFDVGLFFVIRNAYMEKYTKEYLEWYIVKQT